MSPLESFLVARFHELDRKANDLPPEWQDLIRADIDSKLAILAYAAETFTDETTYGTDDGAVACRVILEDLARPFSAHPDWREVWHDPHPG